jgi:hypothetical protein
MLPDFNARSGQQNISTAVNKTPDCEIWGSHGSEGVAVVSQVDTNVSEKHTVSIFRAAIVTYQKTNIDVHVPVNY